MDEKPPEAESPRNGLPIISSDTRDRMLEEMGLLQKETDQPTLGGGHPTDQLIREAIDVQTGKTAREQSERYKRVNDVALSSLIDIADINPGFVRSLKDGVDAGIGQSSSVYSHYFARGIGLVVKAFHIESDYKLIQDLGKLSERDLDEVKQTIANGIHAYQREDNPFSRALNFPRVPTTQSFLREIIEKPAVFDFINFSDRYKVGAGVMYRAMETIWARLYPGQTPPAESPPSAPPQPGSQSPGSL